MPLGEVKREAPAQAELRPTAPGELIQAKTCGAVSGLLNSFSVKRSLFAICSNEYVK
jgi:hypothetical protein